jgi:hypothetical protein
MKRLLIVLTLFFTLSVSISADLPTSNAPRIKVLEGTSSNWSGYAVQTSLTSPASNAVTFVSGTWVVPTISPSGSTSTYSAIWVGIDGYSSNTVEQIGTSQDYVNGTASYYAWYEMYPKWPFRINMKISPGDTIYAEVKYVGSKFQLTLTDKTSGKTFSTTQKGANAKRSSAEWIVEAPWSSGVLPLANFGVVNISGASATLSGHTGSIGDNKWQNDRIDMVSGTVVKAQTSTLDSTGSAFSVTWKGN